MKEEADRLADSGIRDPRDHTLGQYTVDCKYLVTHLHPGVLRSGACGDLDDEERWDRSGIQIDRSASDRQVDSNLVAAATGVLPARVVVGERVDYGLQGSPGDCLCQSGIGR